MPHPYFMAHLPGIVIDIIRYEDNPASSEFRDDVFCDGYYEVIVTITKENMLVCEQKQKLLLVTPKAASASDSAIDENFGVFSIDRDEAPTNILFRSMALETPVGQKEVDVLLFALHSKSLLITRYVSMIFLHDKEAVLETVLPT